MPLTPENHCAYCSKASDVLVTYEDGTATCLACREREQARVADSDRRYAEAGFGRNAAARAVARGREPLAMPSPWTRRCTEMAAKVEQEERLTFRQVVEAALLDIGLVDLPATPERLAEALQRHLREAGYAVHDARRCVRPLAVEGRAMSAEEAKAVGIVL